MKSYTLQVGDKIQIDRFFYQHVGIYVGPRPDGLCVIHNDKVTGVVTLCSLAAFSGGYQITVVTKAAGNSFQRQVVANRALSYLGTKYDLIEFNCEHFASLAQTGKPESPQLTGAIVFGAIALFVLACSRSRA